LASSVTSASQPTVLILGDSISAGYGIPEGRGWVELLRQELQGSALIVNASISGETSGGGLARTDALLARHQPNVFVLELGGNDGLRGFQLNILEDNLSQIINKAKAHNSKVILLGMRIPPNYGKRYSDGFFNIYQTLADRHGVALVPFFLEGVGGHSELIQADGIHPTTAAQPLLLDNARDIILEVLESE